MWHMHRKNVPLGILFLFTALLAAVSPVRGVTPGTPAADSALSLDPFSPSTTSTAASSSTSATAAISSASVATPSSSTTPRTVICPTITYVSVNNAPTAVQGTSSSSTETFTVSLSSASTTPVTVQYTTVDGTAKAGKDYDAKSGTLTFPPGTTSLPVTVTILPETAAQNAAGTLKTFTLALSNPSGATLSVAQGTGTIQPPVVLVMTSNPPPVDQSTAAYERVTFNVTLSCPCTTPVTVDYTTADGTAKKNVDYQPQSGSLTFPPGVTTLPVKVWILPGTATTNRVFYLDLSNASGAPGVKISDPQATATIIGQNSQNVPALTDTDVYITQSTTSNVTAQFVVTLTTAMSKTVTVKYATYDVSGGAVAGTDYLSSSGTLTFPPGQTSEVLPLTILKGNLTSDKIFKLELSNSVNAPIYRPTATITILPPTLDVAVSDAPADQQSGTHSTTSTFTVTLSGLSAHSVTVEYSTSDGTAIHGTDYVAASGILTFTPYTLVKTVNVTVLPGSSTSNRVFYLNLNNPSTGVIITRAKGTGPILGHQCGCVTLSVNDITVNQSKTAKVTATFTVTLTNPATFPVTVQYATANGAAPSAEAGEDYNAVSGTLTFAPGQTSKSVPVTILPENENFAEIFYLNLSNPSGAVISRAQGTCTIIPTIIDIAVSNSPTVFRSATADTYATFKVALSSITEATVTVKYATADGSAVHNTDYTATSGTLTFTPLTMTATVQVPVLPGTQSSNKTFYLNLSNASGTGAVISVGQGSAVIEGEANPPPPILSINNISVVQNKSVKVTATFTVTLSTASVKPITFQYATANGPHPGPGGGATAGANYTAASGTLTIAPGNTTITIPITILPQNVNYEEAFQVNLSSANGATIGTGQGTCTIIPATIDVTVNNPALVTRKSGSDTYVTFTISLSSVSNSVLTVEYATSDGSATHSVDYDSASGTVTFGIGQTTKTVTVTVLPGTGSAIKTFYLNLIDSVGPGATISTSKGTAQIQG